MNLKALTNDELDCNLMNCVKKEKAALHFIISHIAEVNRRKMYLDFAYPSLRAYLEERMGYDGGSAQRRIDAARLSQVVPGVIESLQHGELKLAQVTVLQKSLRETKNQVVSKETKVDLVEAIKNKSIYETQVLVAKALNVEIKTASKITPQADESVRLELSLTKDQWEKLNSMRELLSHSVPNGSWSALLEYLSDRVIQQKTGGKSHMKSAPSLHLLKKQVLQRDRCCQFKNKEGKICGSRWNLQTDHIQPQWAGGKDTLENLRALCGNHNRHVYRKQAGIKTL